MSFGFSTGEIVNLVQLALKIVQNCQKACGEHDELTREVSNLHLVVTRLQKEVETPGSLLHRADDSTKEELSGTIIDCDKILQILDKILTKYNGMSEEKRAVRKLWKVIRFGNGEMQDLSDLRGKIETYASVITLQLNLISMGSQGRVEQQMDQHGSELRAMRQSLNFITASLSTGHEGSILTNYSGDDKIVWRELRRELVMEGFSSEIIFKHKSLIVAYVKELGDRGALDDNASVSRTQLSVMSEPVDLEGRAEEPEVAMIDISDTQTLSQATRMDSMRDSIITGLLKQDRKDEEAENAMVEIPEGQPRSGGSRRERTRYTITETHPRGAQRDRGRHGTYAERKSRYIGFECRQCHRLKKTRNGPLVLNCGHGWCVGCFFSLGFGYMLAVNVPEPDSCCEKLIYPILMHDPEKPTVQDLCDSIKDDTLIAFGVDPKGTFCPFIHCGKQFDEMTPSKVLTDSEEEVSICRNCQRDVCITCNEALHDSTLPCVSAEQRQLNVARMGMLGVFTKILRSPTVTEKCDEVRDPYDDTRDDVIDILQQGCIDYVLQQRGFILPHTTLESKERGRRPETASQSRDRRAFMGFSRRLGSSIRGQYLTGRHN